MFKSSLASILFKEKKKRESVPFSTKTSVVKK